LFFLFHLFADTDNEEYPSMVIFNIDERRDDERSIIKQYDQNTIRLYYTYVFSFTT